MVKDYYSILGITSDASIDAIKKAYRINAIKYHPDKNFGDPKFTEKFIEIREAYENLINPEKRHEFDIKYKEFWSQMNARSSKENKFESENTYEQSPPKKEFVYEPFVQFFSSAERKLQETPQLRPEKTPWGTPIPENTIFFIYPKNVGKIIGGASNVTEGIKRETLKDFEKNVLKVIFKNALIIFILFALNYLYLYFINKENSIHIAIFFWSVIAIIRTLLTVFRYHLNKQNIFLHNINYFIGINGFAYYKYEEPNESKIEKIEINFNDVTDLLSIYENGDNGFIWTNRFSNKVVYSEIIKNKNIDSLSKSEFNKYAEKYFTIYLLDKMELELEQKGYIEFLVSFKPYIRLGIGFITFLQGEESVTYNFDDIKRITTVRL
jgi:curved DNA-binding protein CbpA